MERTPFPQSGNRQHSTSEQAQLTELPLSDWQWEWTLDKYLEQTPYPNVRDFCSYVTAMVGEIPDDLICRAEMHDSPIVEEMVEELGELESAWIPTPETERRINEIRAILEAAL